MATSTSIFGEFTLRDSMSDLGLRFADSPLHRIGFEITDADIDLLVQAYPDRVFRSRRKAAPDRLHWFNLVLRFGENVFLVAFGDGREWAEILAPTEEQAVALHTEIEAKLKLRQREEAPFFYMLRHESGDFLTERVDEIPDEPGDEFMRLSYGSDIDSWLGQFAERTTQRAGGLSILEGPPGTGKTSLVSVMMRRFEKSHVFYVMPAAQEDALVSAEMVPFWQSQNKRHPDRIKVIVMEDAERLLWPRRGENREAVASVLNIADGLVGRMLRLHIVCSVNASLDQLDPAIRRPGRLMNQRVFRRLPRQTAQQLAALRSLPFTGAGDRADFALAEVLNPGAAPIPERLGIGFAQ